MYRYRVGTNQSVMDDYHHTWIHSNGTVYHDDYHSYESLRNFVGMKDVVTPNFRERQLSGEIINNPMWQEYYYKNQQPFYCYQKTDSGSAYVHGHDVAFGFEPNVSPNIPLLWENDPDMQLALDAWLDDRAGGAASISNNMANANVDQSEMLLLASLGESRETVKWISSIFRRAVTVIRLVNGRSANKVPWKTYAKMLRKIHKRKAAYRSIVGASELWLEYRYALRPLIFELKQASDALEAELGKNDRYTSRGWAQDEDSSESTTTLYTANSQVDQVEKYVWKVTSRSGVLYQIDTSFNNKMIIWGIDRPLQSVYELVPFSFIWDWFFDTGLAVAALSQPSSLQSLAKWNNVVVNQRRSYSYKNLAVHTHPPSATFTIEQVGTQSFVESITRRRRLPDASISLVPTWNPRLDTGKLFDILTILRALVSGGVPSYVKRG